MKVERDGWRARLTAHIRATGGRVTAPRLRVAEVFFAMKGHPGVDEVVKAVHGRWPGIGHATVYRTLHLLAQAGLVESRQFGEGFARYEAAASREHHDHLVCTACGAILEFEDPGIEAMQQGVAERHGFRMLGHRLDIYGLCASCGKAGIPGHRRPQRRPRRPRRTA